MYKLLFVFFMFLSSPLYSDEFTYHCDSEDNVFSMVFDINTIEQTVVHTHSIYKEMNTVSNVNESYEIYKWDKEYDIVWLTEYFVFDGSPTLTIFVLNFEQQKFFLKEIFIDGSSRNETFNCYTME